MSSLVASSGTKPRKAAAKALVGFIVIMALLTIGSRTLENLSMAVVAVTRPTGGMLERVLETSGTVETSNDKAVKAEDALTVLAVHVRTGDTVEAGAPLVTLDIGPLEDKLAQAKIDLQRKELSLESAEIPTGGTTPEEMLREALRTREDAGETVTERELDADMALVKAEETLDLNKKLMERTITKTLKTAEGAVVQAQAARTENVDAAAKAYSRAQRSLAELIDPRTGSLAKEKAAAYETFLNADQELSRAITDESNAIRDATDAVAKASAAKAAAQAALDANTDPAKDDELKKALAEAVETLQSAINNLETVKKHRADLVAAAYSARDKAREVYSEAADMNAPKNRNQIEVAQDALAAAQKAYDKAVKDNNAAVKEAQAALTNTKQAKKKWLAGTLVSNNENTPADIESVLKNLESTAQVLEEAQKNREKVLKQNGRTLEDADRALNKAREEAARQSKTNRIAEETRKLDSMAARMEIDKVKTNIARIEQLLSSKGNITAPVAGTISEITAKEGAAPAEGAVIARIAAGEKSMMLVAVIPAADAKQLKVGLDAELYSNSMFAMGKIADIRKADTSGQTGGQAMYEVRIDINPERGSFLAGDSVRVTIRQSSQRYNTIIPLSALREDSNGKFVFILEEQSGALGTRQIVRRVDVTVQESSPTHAAVSGALSDWDKLVERGDRELKDGDRVRIQQ